MMNAKNKFKEGWVMLLQPFDFAELKEPLQKLTILYVYSEKPIIKLELSKEGEELINELQNEVYDISQFFSDEDAEKEYDLKVDYILSKYSTVEIYEGEIVQAIVEGKLCKFYPEEYKIIEKETFNHVLTAPEYSMEIENKTMFNRAEVATRIHYIRSRGVDKNLAERMSASDAKDSVIFRPRKKLLEYFCRENEIYEK